MLGVIGRRPKLQSRGHSERSASAVKNLMRCAARYATTFIANQILRQRRPQNDRPFVNGVTDNQTSLSCIGPGSFAEATAKGLFSIMIQDSWSLATAGQSSSSSQTRSFAVSSAFSSKSGRRCRVRRRACLRRHSAILAWWPEVRISGTARPRNSGGRVYWG